MPALPPLLPLLPATPIDRGQRRPLRRQRDASVLFARHYCRRHFIDIIIDIFSDTPYAIDYFRYIITSGDTPFSIFAT
jgi:hypothetical protein